MGKVIDSVLPYGTRICMIQKQRATAMKWRSYATSPFTTFAGFTPVRRKSRPWKR